MILDRRTDETFGSIKKGDSALSWFELKHERISTGCLLFADIASR
jgi:hypothetical protein